MPDFRVIVPIICLAFSKEVLSLPRENRAFLHGNVKFTFPKEIFTEKVGVVDFDVLPTTMTLLSVEIQQKYYAAIMKGYALCFILSYNSEEQESALKSILASVTLKPSMR